jgi:hypothetical protein
MLDRGQKMAMGIRVPVHANVLEYKSRVDDRIPGSESKLLGILCGMLCGLVTLDSGIPAPSLVIFLNSRYHSHSLPDHESSSHVGSPVTWNSPYSSSQTLILPEANWSALYPASLLVS